MTATAEKQPATDHTVDLRALYTESNIGGTIATLDRELVGLVPVKTRIREIAALLLVERARRQLGLQAESPSLHMSFTGNPGTGKTTVANRMAEILHQLGYIRRNQVVSVTRDDLVGQYIGHTAPKTKEVLKKAMGGVLFIDEAYYLYRPENERDYGQEAIEILLQVMEDRRDDLVVILAGYKDRMDIFFRSNPGMASRVAHHIDFPDYGADELLHIAELMLAKMHYRFDDAAKTAMTDYIARRMAQPRFSNARSIRNALDRARLRQANRLFASATGPLDRLALETIAAADIRASRVFQEQSGNDKSSGINMMPHRAKTFSKFIIEQLRGTSEHGADLAALLNDVQTACKFIAMAVSRGGLSDAAPAEGAVNIHGELQKPLDMISNEIMLTTCEYGGQLRGMVSEELDEPYTIPTDIPRGRYLLVFDPLDGSSGIDINMTVGTIFSILVAPDQAGDPAPEDFLQPGTQQVAAGYAIYGPVSMLVVTLGNGVHGFTLNREIGAYTLTHPGMRIPETAREFAINASNERFWEPPVRRYVNECIAGSTGPRGVDFNMRWIACMVAEVHRILIRGGLFMYPRDTRDTSKPGRLRLLYEANPMAMIVEQAGGGASTARGRILDIKPSHIHQRVPVALGSRAEVERLVRYHEAYDRGDSEAFEAPLFRSRGLFRTA